MLMRLDRQQETASETDNVFRAFHANDRKVQDAVDFVVGTMIDKNRSLLTMDQLERFAVDAGCGFTRVELYHLLSRGVPGLELRDHAVKFAPSALPEAYVARHASLGNFLAALDAKSRVPETLQREELARRMDTYASAWKPIRPFRGNVRPAEYVRRSDVLHALFSSRRNLETVIAAVAAGKELTLAALQRLLPDESLARNEDRGELEAFGILDGTRKGWKVNGKEWPGNVRSLAMHSLGIAARLWRHLPPEGYLSNDAYAAHRGPVAHDAPFLPGADAFELDPYVPDGPAEAPIGYVLIPDWWMVASEELPSGATFVAREGMHVGHAFQHSSVRNAQESFATPYVATFPTRNVAPDVAENHLLASTETIVSAESMGSVGGEESLDAMLARVFTGEDEPVTDDADAFHVEEEEEWGRYEEPRSHVLHRTKPSGPKGGYRPRARPLKAAVDAAMKERRKQRRVEKMKNTWAKKKEERDAEMSGVLSANGVVAPPQERLYIHGRNLHESILLNHYDDFRPVADDNEEPTMALPGTEEKIEVLADRLRRGVPLWHPRDRLGLDEGSADEEAPPFLRFLRGRG